MTLTRVIGKHRTREMDGDELAARLEDAVRTVVDVGTGDGRYVYALAGEHPDWLVIGIDALDEPMGDIAYRASRKPTRGGRNNVVLLRAAIERIPDALHAVADDVRVMLPWGNLLEGIVLGEQEVLCGLAAICRPGALVTVTLNGEIWEESTPVRYEQLPVPTPAHVAAVVAPAFAAAGIDIGPARHLTVEETKIASTWARKLAHGRAHPKFLRFDGRAHA